MTGPRRPHSNIAKPGEIYFEHVRFGTAVKCSAIDADSGTEVSVMGPANVNQHTLEALALKKLKMVMARKVNNPQG